MHDVDATKWSVMVGYARARNHAAVPGWPPAGRRQRGRQAGLCRRGVAKRARPARARWREINANVASSTSNSADLDLVTRDGCGDELFCCCSDNHSPLSRTSFKKSKVAPFERPQRKPVGSPLLPPLPDLTALGATNFNRKPSPLCPPPLYWSSGPELGIGAGRPRRSKGRLCDIGKGKSCYRNGAFWAAVSGCLAPFAGGKTATAHDLGPPRAVLPTF